MFWETKTDVDYMHAHYCMGTGVYNLHFHENESILQITLIAFFPFSLFNCLLGVRLYVD